MNLEEKTEKYYQECLVELNYSESQTAFCKEDYKSGYNSCKEDLKDFIKANPKITADKITEYLNSL